MSKKNSIKQIARERCVSRNTVRKVIREDEVEFRYQRKKPRKSKLEEYRQNLEEIRAKKSKKMEESECENFHFRSRFLMLVSTPRSALLRQFRHRFDTQFQTRRHQLVPTERSHPSGGSSLPSSVIVVVP